MRRASLAAVAVCAVLAACGDDDERTADVLPATTTGTVPAVTTPTITTPAETAPQTTTSETTPEEQPAATTGEPSGGVTAPAEEEAPEGGAGDEEAIRVPAEFSVGSGRLQPDTVTVPAFLQVEVTFRSADGKAHELAIKAPGGEPIRLGAGSTARMRLGGLRPGTYPIAVDGQEGGKLVASNDAAGP